MRRRELLIAFGSVITWCTSAHPQQRSMRLVGILEDSPPVSPVVDEWVRMFKEKMREYGWVEGQSIRFERRKAGTDVEQGRREAAVLVELKPDVLVSSSTVVTAALAERTSDIPIVFMGVYDPIVSGFSDSLARPSRNLTGFTVFNAESAGGKNFQLLKELKPDLKRVTVMGNPDIGAGRKVAEAYNARMTQIAADNRLELGAAPVHDATEIEQAFAALGQDDGVLLSADKTIVMNTKLIIELAARHKIITMYAWPQQVTLGGLMSTSQDYSEQWRNAADYTNRLLAGTRLEELPIQRPSRGFDLTINLKTAKELGITVPREILVLARDVIE